MLDRLLGFEWDIHNVGHIAEHDVVPAEVEEAVSRPNVVVPSTAGGKEQRWKFFGRTNASRYLVVVFTIRKSRFRTVTAYTMNQAERKIHGPKIED